MKSEQISLLFLCTGNSARSILAEAIANEMFGDHLKAESAGSKPKGEPHPLALETLRRNGLPAEGWRSKSWDEFTDRSFDLVVTLCGSAARETCPAFPGAPVTVHWGLPDPPAADEPVRMFQEVYEVLVRALRQFVEDDGTDVISRARAVAAMTAKRYPAAA